MKLNYRDKVLLTTVAVILVWVIGIMLFIKPAIENVNTAQSSLDEVTVTLSDLQNQIDQDKDLQQRIDDSYKKVSQASANFYDYQLAQDATQTVDDLLAKDTIENSSMTITTYSVSVLSPYTYVSTEASTDMDIKVDDYGNGSVAADTTEGTATDDGTAAVSSDVSIGSYTINVAFSGSMENLKNFCEKLTTNTEKTLVLSSLSISDVNADQVEGTMTLNMMVLKKLSDPNAAKSE